MDEFSGAEKIKLTYLNGTGFVFNIDDYMTIRKKYRITGSPVGASQSHGWNPNINGLPIELTKFEIQLLLEKNLAVLLRKTSLNEAPNQESLEKINEFIEKRAEEQMEILKTNKIEESKKCIDKILQGKRKKLIKSGVPETEINVTPESVLKEIADSYVFSPDNLLIDVPYECPFSHEVEIVEYPKDESLEYKVFRDLWEKEKFITSGEPFGGDFIVYPGDPVMFHASHIIVVLKDASIRPTDLVAKGRLSVIVNKNLVFAYQNAVGEISYQTVQWMGCKDNYRKKNYQEL